MFQAILRTMTELLDSKKAAYSVVATALAVVLHVHFGVSPQDALLLVSPLGVATMAQAHVDASGAKAGAATSASNTTVESSASDNPST